MPMPIKWIPVGQPFNRRANHGTFHLWYNSKKGVIRIPPFLPTVLVVIAILVVDAGIRGETAEAIRNWGRMYCLS